MALVPLMMAANVGAGIMGAIGAIQQGNEAKRAGLAQQAIYNLNADLVDAKITDTVRTIDRAKVATVGRQRAQYASSGVDVSSGSPLDIEYATNLSFERDKIRAEEQAKFEAIGLRFSGEEAARAGKFAQEASRFAAAGSLLGGAGRAASLGYQSGYLKAD